MTSITLSHLSKSFALGKQQVQALDRVSLSVRSGEIFGVIGRSGAGKSTLLRAINLLERPDQGRVDVGGVDLMSLAPPDLRRERQKIGMIFQHFNLLARRTVYDNVALPLELAGWNKAKIKDRVMPLLHLVGLEEKRDQVPATLSGGQKQRVGIARALAPEPTLLLSDEATSALDTQTTQSILHLLQDINQRLGLTIILITHEMAVVREICHRIAVMDAGRIVETGPTFDLLTRPTHPITRDIAASLDIHPPFDSLYGGPLVTERPADGATILRIVFTGPTAERPVIADWVRRLGIDINILSAHIDYIQKRPFGIVTAEISGPLEPVLTHLSDLGQSVEVLGHVRRKA